MAVEVDFLEARLGVERVVVAGVMTSAVEISTWEEEEGVALEEGIMSMAEGEQVAVKEEVERREEDFVILEDRVALTLSKRALVEALLVGVAADVVAFLF